MKNDTPATMRSLTAPELLAAWEQGAARSNVERALILLAAACPEESPDDLAALSIGRRDDRLLMLRERLFGSHLVGVSSCPGCGDRVQFTFTASEVRSKQGGSERDPLVLRLQGYEVRFRLPDSNDQALILKCSDAVAARRLLLTRCLQAIRCNEKELSAEQTPDDILGAVSELMAKADPQADIRLMMACPACAHEWSATFDIVSYLWHEIESWALRILRDIHTLASAYGWREADILSMSAMRRQAYLDMAASLPLRNDERLSRQYNG